MAAFSSYVPVKNYRVKPVLEDTHFLDEKTCRFAFFLHIRYILVQD